KALQGGLTNMVTPSNLYNSAKLVTRITGHKDLNAFFTDPSTQPPPQPKPDPKLLEIQAQAQTDEKQVQMKFQFTAALEREKFEHEKALELLEAGRKTEEHKHNLVLKTADHIAKTS